MRFLVTVCALAALARGGAGGALTKSSGIEQFWTDDYKTFERVYGKTSDRDIYGVSLPTSGTNGGNAKKKDALDNKERYAVSYNLDTSTPNSIDDSYNHLITKHTVPKIHKNEPATSLHFIRNFISNSDFKPISQTNDPETYNYLKDLEHFSKEEKFEFPKSVDGFKPYLNYLGRNSEESDAFENIQDILDAHEANKANSYKDNNGDKGTYFTHKKNNVNKPTVGLNSFNKTKCVIGRCRKRGSSPIRVRSRPYVRKIKHSIVSYN